MAKTKIGRQAMDIFQSTQEPTIGLDVAPRTKGRPAAAEAYEKATVCIYKRQVVFLDRVALNISERTGRHVRRAELFRALVEMAIQDQDFEKNVERFI